ncbi:hypothetical protein RND71_012804 [Anisodus tanguticus]|uniref:Myb/SANT-like DNA-binding domain-containing protein n=1 Tax=Anisodus tanguticus TaxID=243964 RepID=A0AAE1SG56_9SOLA|nr:hypothetical protein RND71_012804 [Anisodus tanguticus]
MFRQHNHTDIPSPISSSNPNSSTTSNPLHSPAAAAVSHSGTMSDDNSPSPSPPPSPPDNKQLALPPPPTLTRVSVRTPVFPSREDCWSEAATHTLIEAWGSKYVELNRGNLRHQHWEEVANAVNALHGHTKKQCRTDIQCKNRIDTLKKKYKIERTKISQSNGRYVSTWPFFSSLNALIGVTFKVSPSPPPPPPETATFNPHRRTPPPPPVMPAIQWRTPLPETPLQWRTPPPEAPLQWRGLRSKRDYTVSRRNFSAMAAAAAAAFDDSGEEEKEESETSSLAAMAIADRKRKRSGGGLVEGYKMLAEAIGRFSEIYERVEKAKQRQMVELEKQRMQFAKDLEIQRMKLIMESQVHLEKIKRSKTQFRRW